jgi:uncharacterized protein
MSRECWLVSKGTVIAAAERATTHRERGRGLLGREGIEGAMVLDRTRWVHSIGMRFAIDVAHVRDDGTVVRVVHLKPNRIGPWVRNASWVVEAEAGAFERWGLQVGEVLEVRE